MASLARCLNQTLLQQSQEEEEWFRVQSCRPADETEKEGKGQVCHWKGLTAWDSIFGLYLYILQNPWPMSFFYTLEWDFLGMWEVQIVYLSIRINARTMCCTYISVRRGNQRIETGWMVNKLLCCSCISTFATSANISAISCVLNGLQIKRVQLFAEFAFICLWHLVAKFNFDVSKKKIWCPFHALALCPSSLEQLLESCKHAAPCSYRHLF